MDPSCHGAVRRVTRDLTPGRRGSAAVDTPPTPDKPAETMASPLTRIEFSLDATDRPD